MYLWAAREVYQQRGSPDVRNPSSSLESPLLYRDLTRMAKKVREIEGEKKDQKKVNKKKYGNIYCDAKLSIFSIF
jgi:hypothetical protein